MDTLEQGALEKSIRFYLWAIVPPILLTIGTIGNGLTIAVLCRRSMRASQASVYLIALSVADIIVLYTGMLRHFIKEVTGVDVRHLSVAGCKINLVVVYASLDISVWILVAFTFERILSVFTPYKVKTYCSKLSSLLVIAGIAIVLIGLNSHFLYGKGDLAFTYRNKTYLFHCVNEYVSYNEFVTKHWPWIDFSVFCLVPFLILITGNLCIAVRVIVSRRKVRRVATSDSTQPVPAIQPSAITMTYRSGLSSPMRTSARTDKTSTMTAILLILNLVFLVTTTPVSVFFIIQPSWVDRLKTPRDQELMELTFAVVNLIQYINNSINFILYCITGSRFRRELQSMVTRRQESRIHPLLANIGHQVNEPGRRNLHLQRSTATSEMPPTPVEEGENLHRQPQQLHKNDDTTV